MKGVLLAVAIISFGLCASSGRSPAKTLTTSSAETTITSPSSDPDDTAQHFEGVIVSKNGELLVLRDDAHNTWYHLDDQQAASKHLGKKVLVTGTLDARTDVIRVKAIDEAS